MDNQANTPVTIDAYIEQYPPHIQDIMQELRAVIRETAPDATERISWGMATFVQQGNLVHFAGHKNHLGFYPGSAVVQQFQQDLEKYRFTTGAIQFPYNEPIPFDLVRRIVLFRILENAQIIEERLQKKKSKSKQKKEIEKE